MEKKTMVVIGAGKGISLATARKFGQLGFQVALVSRNQQHLDGLCRELEKENIQAKGFVADVADEASLTNALEKIKQAYPTIDVLHYNAALRNGKPILEENAASLVDDFKINVAGFHTAVKGLVEELQRSQGAALVTGGGLSLFPNPAYGSLSIGKAGIRSLAKSLNQALHTRGIFVGTVTIKGVVSENARVHNPANIAEKFWELYTRREEFEIQL